VKTPPLQNQDEQKHHCTIHMDPKNRKHNKNNFICKVYHFIAHHFQS
jgi:hypothetical protein